jgi:hypothetical protein
VPVEEEIRIAHAVPFFYQRLKTHANQIAANLKRSEKDGAKFVLEHFIITFWSWFTSAVVAQYEIDEVDWNGTLGRLVISFRCSSIWSLWLCLLFRCDLDEWVDETRNGMIVGRFMMIADG